MDEELWISTFSSLTRFDEPAEGENHVELEEDLNSLRQSLKRLKIVYEVRFSEIKARLQKQIEVYKRRLKALEDKGSRETLREIEEIFKRGEISKEAYERLRREILSGKGKSSQNAPNSEHSPPSD